MISTPAPLPAPVRAALAATVPGTDAATATVIGEGWGSVAYRLPDPTGDWVLRLARPRAPWALGDLEREVRLLPLLERQPFDNAVPRDARLLRDGHGRTLGALHRLVPGTPLMHAPMPRGRVRAALLADIGRALSVLHATPRTDAQRHGVREVDLWNDHYVAQIERALPLLPPGSRAWLAAKAETFERESGTSRAPRVLIHGDLSGDHLLVDERGRLAGLIDFGDAMVADPALDFAGILNGFRWDDLRVVLDHYQGEVDPGWLHRARFYIDVVPIYQVTDGAVAVGPEEQRRGVRRLAARAAATTRAALRGAEPMRTARRSDEAPREHSGKVRTR